MTITGPIVAGVTLGCVSFALKAIVDRTACTSSSVSAATAADWSSFRPTTGVVTSGFELRSNNRDETGSRLNRFASFAMNERTSCLSTFARNARVVSGATVIAFATAASVGTVIPSRFGETLMVVLSKCSVTGCSNASSTAAAATSGARPPIWTPASVTPVGTTAGAGVIVVVVVVSV